MTAFVVEKFRIWPDMYIDLLEFMYMGRGISMLIVWEEETSRERGAISLEKE